MKGRVVLQVLRLIARYGARALRWAYANKRRILRWIRDGLAIDAIIARIRRILGI